MVGVTGASGNHLSGYSIKKIIAEQAFWHVSDSCFFNLHFEEWSLGVSLCDSNMFPLNGA